MDCGDLRARYHSAGDILDNALDGSASVCALAEWSSRNAIDAVVNLDMDVPFSARFFHKLAFEANWQAGALCY